MSQRYQGGFITASYNGLKAPDAPTIGTATVASGTSASVTFTAPSNVGGGAITSYTVIATDSSSGATFTGTGASSPVIVSGLTTGNTYTAKVYATNAYGAGPLSASSNSITPSVIGQQAYTSDGTYSWVAPTGVTSVSVVAVGAGGGGTASSGGANGGGGGELRYKNNITVTPGNSYTVVVGLGGTTYNSQDGGASSFNSTTCVANGGINGAGSRAGGSGGTGDGGGNGGAGGDGGGSYRGGGGGAAGYAGTGGAGATSTNGTAGSGGGGGGGGAGGTGSFGLGGPGGGVGLLGEGSSGAGGDNTGNNGGSASGTTGIGGSGGSGSAGNLSGYGNDYGGGAPSYYNPSATNQKGGLGAVRIIWPGTTRSFPSTNTGDL